MLCLMKWAGLQAAALSAALIGLRWKTGWSAHQPSIQPDSTPGILSTTITSSNHLLPGRLQAGGHYDHPISSRSQPTRRSDLFLTAVERLSQEPWTSTLRGPPHEHCLPSNNIQKQRRHRCSTLTHHDRTARSISRALGGPRASGLAYYRCSTSEWPRGEPPTANHNHYTAVST